MDAQVAYIITTPDTLCPGQSTIFQSYLYIVFQAKVSCSKLQPMGCELTASCSVSDDGSAELWWIHDIWSKTISLKQRLVESDIWSIRHFVYYDVW